MSGAQAYTTSRGKNKKRKESKRMDNKNNNERKLKTKATDHSGFAGVQKEKFGVAGHLMGGGATGVSSVHTRLKDNPQTQLKAMREKCCYTPCSKTAGELAVVLKDCSVCRQVKYCSRDCQVADWKAGHGKDCKILAAGGKLAIAPAAEEGDSGDEDGEDEEDEEDSEDDEEDDEEEGEEGEEGDREEQELVAKPAATEAAVEAAEAAEATSAAVGPS